MENIISNLDQNQRVNKNQARTLITILFVIVPILSSIISTYHLIGYFQIGHSFILALILGVTFEIGAVSSFLALTVLKKINRNFVWGVFFAITSVQILGNIYYVFNYIHHKVLEDPNWMLTIIQIFEWFGFGAADAGIIVSISSGAILPLISLFLLKSTAEYLDQGNFDDNEKIKNIETNKEVQIIEKIIEVEKPVERIIEVEKIVEVEPKTLTLEEEIDRENNYLLDDIF